MTGRSLTRPFFTVAALILAASPAYGGVEEGQILQVDPLWIIPFILLLLSIALMPFINRHWWERNYPVVSLTLGAATVAYYIFVLGRPERMLRTGVEYLSFILLIGSLFVVAGGIHIRLSGKSTPLSNTLFLAVGAIASNLVGTTGASMIMIRPFLRVNAYRLSGYHVAFFIFIVSNIGGALTPIGDPPLFLGYLRGIPFFWVLTAVWHIWVLAILLLLLVFYLLDVRGFRKFRARAGAGTGGELHGEASVSGLHNLIFLLLILVSVFIEHPVFLREVIMIAAAAGSYFTTGRDIHRANNFNFTPAREVAILFLGIFATMVPALDSLELGASRLGLLTPGHYFWYTGFLSGVLDNAPTYLSFLSAAVGSFIDHTVIQQVQHLVLTKGADIASLAGSHAEEARRTFEVLMKYHADMVLSGSVPLADIHVSYLIANRDIIIKAISLGAVFFGAMTYIGNGPNFMVKSIVENSGMAGCPGFIAYIYRYSLPVLIPLFILIWALFFRV